MTDDPMDAALRALQASWMAEAKEQEPHGAAASRCLIDYPFHVFSRRSLWCQCGQRHIDGNGSERQPTGGRIMPREQTDRSVAVVSPGGVPLCSRDGCLNEAGGFNGERCHEHEARRD